MSGKVIIQEPDDDGFYLDFGVVKNELISNLPQGYLKMKNNGETHIVAPQDIIDESYDSFIQSNYMFMPCKYFYELNGTSFSKKVLKRFFQKTKLDDKLQTQSIFLSNDLWNYVVTMPKKHLKDNYFQRSISEDMNQVNYSSLELSVGSKEYLSILNTIQFRFDETFDKKMAKVISKECYDHFREMFEKIATSDSVDSIDKLASFVENFSIHKYFLPNGPEKLDDACLLIRYDSTYQKHKNGAMPPLYKKVYSQVVAEPHFHFTRGFGSVYKLTNSMNKEDFATGYAIGVNDLRNYLHKLNTRQFVDAEERKLYLENDFGMPFLKIFRQAYGKNILKTLERMLIYMQLDSLTHANAAHASVAYNFMDICTGAKGVYPFEPIKYKNPYQQEENKDKDR